MTKPKKRKWKVQDQHEEKSGDKKVEVQNGPSIGKMPATEAIKGNWANIEAKRKITSDQVKVMLLTSPKAKQKLDMEMMEQQDSETWGLATEVSEYESPALLTAMNIISWNVRGLKSNPTFREAKKMLQMHKPKIMFFCETKLTTRQMQVTSQKLRFENCFGVDK